jgi:hypothetical protein
LVSTAATASTTAVATGATGVAAAATVGLDFLATVAVEEEAAAATGADAATGVATASDFLETFLTLWAEVVEVGLLIVLIPVEVFDINKRGMIFSTCKSVIKFCE